MPPAPTRDAVTGSEGSATVPALSLTGTYTVSVSKDGFGTEQRKDIALRSGETATIRVTLAVGSSKAEVTVVGTRRRRARESADWSAAGHQTD